MADLDLADWLTRQYDDDEKTATGLRSMVRSLSELNDRMPPDSRRGTQVYDAASWALARLLDDLAAKREIVKDYQVVVANNAIRNAVDGDEVQAAVYDLIAKSLGMVLRRLAAPYAGGPGWKDEWAVA